MPEALAREKNASRPCPAVSAWLRSPALLWGAMTKQKTKKAVVKRMKLTKNGKVKRRQSFTSHLMVRRSRKRKRQLRAALILEGGMGRNMAKCLGQG